MNVLQLRFVILPFVFFLFFALVNYACQAQGQPLPLPSGSYEKTCTNCSFEGHQWGHTSSQILSCKKCKRKNGSFVASILTVEVLGTRGRGMGGISCVGDISNQDGTLACKKKNW